MSGAYYNEIDPFAAAWLRELIKQNAIAPGDVDERDIRDVRPADLAGYTQCHFFAGIGVWSYALRRAGWSDARHVWTASCPCQPFSAAGKGAGFDDERHLWPALYHLIGERRPACLFGEQVASKPGLAWLDLVYADMEAADYAIGAADTCAAGVGAPHIRQRLYWVAHAAGSRRERSFAAPEREARDEARVLVSGAVGEAGGLGHSGGERRQQERGSAPRDEGAHGREQDGYHVVASAGEAGGLGDAEREGLEGYAGHGGYPRGRSFALGSVAASGAVGGFWRGAHVVYCRDEKLRPVEPGTFPLAHGAPARVGRLRGYGNAINAEVAQAFIEAYLTH